MPSSSHQDLCSAMSIEVLQLIRDNLKTIGVGFNATKSSPWLDANGLPLVDGRWMSPFHPEPMPVEAMSQSIVFRLTREVHVTDDQMNLNIDEAYRMVRGEMASSLSDVLMGFSMSLFGNDSPVLVEAGISGHPGIRCEYVPKSPAMMRGTFIMSVYFYVFSPDPAEIKSMEAFKESQEQSFVDSMAEKIMDQEEE